MFLFDWKYFVNIRPLTLQLWLWLVSLSQEAFFSDSGDTLRRQCEPVTTPLSVRGGFRHCAKDFHQRQMKRGVIRWSLSLVKPSLLETNLKNNFARVGVRQVWSFQKRVIHPHIFITVAERPFACPRREWIGGMN